MRLGFDNPSVFPEAALMSNPLPSDAQLVLLDAGSVRPGDLDKVRALIAHAEGRGGKRGGR